MSSTERLAGAWRKAADTTTSAQARLGISRRGVGLLVGAVAATCVSGIVLVAVSQDVIQTDGLALHDSANLSFVADHRNTTLVSAARLLTNFGGVAVLLMIALAAAGLLWFRGARLILAAAPLLSLGIAGLIAGAGKVLVGRNRPPAGLRLVPETDASFPSGHSTDSAALYLALALVLGIVVFHKPLLRVLSVAAAATLAALIGASRLVLGVHWPTDVIVGLALGATVAIAVTTTAFLVSRLTPAEPTPEQGRAAWTWYRLRDLLILERPSLQAVRSS